MRNVRMVVAYLGTAFHGVAPNRGARTVLGELQPVVERICRSPVALTLAGRTDAGVHAWGQVISGRLPDTVDLGRLQRSVNRICGPEVVIRSIEWAPEDFDARFSATARTYRYSVWNDAVADPFRSAISWHVPSALDVAAMNEAASALIGEHDFAAFCRASRPAPGAAPRSTVRIVASAEWERIDDSPMLCFGITASSFCHQMVRSIVGTLVEVGRGRRDVSSVAGALDQRSRSAAGAVAPPHGLVLWSVAYDGTRWDASASAS
jgi:tRNA pseudouridine38-40 synthase